jgi:transposase
MKRFVEGEDRRQGVLLPEYLDDFVAEENQVRVIEAFVDELDLRGLGFEGVVPEATGRPAYHPATMLKIWSTATSTRSSRADVWSAKRRATSR